jgi:phosphatidylinositol-3-phosphatase
MMTGGHLLMRWYKALLFLFLSFLLCIAEATPRQPAGRLNGRQTLPRYAHVVVVIEENKSFSTVIGSKDAPYINHLAGEGVLFTDMHAVTHPSQPNYLALFSGSTQGTTDDSCPQDFSGPNLASAMQQRKLGFAIYSEDLPKAGFRGCSGSGGLYRRKHNPVADWQISSSPAVNQPFSAFPHDYTKLPVFAFVVPNMMDDMHDGTIEQGDTWLKQHLDGYARWAKQHDSLLIVTWDESDAGSPSNQIPALMVGAGIKPGSSAQYLTHYSLLRTLNDMYRLKPIGDAAAAQPIRGIWVRSANGR